MLSHLLNEANRTITRQSKKNGVSRISLGKKRTKASTLVADWWFHKMKKDFRKNSLHNMDK